MLFFVAAECISVAVVFAIGFLYGAIEDLSAIAPWTMAGAGVGLLVTCLHLLISVFRRKREKLLFWVAEAVMLLGLFPGIVLFAELINLDLCRRWLSWFGASPTAQLFTVLGLLAAASFALLLLAYLLPLLPLRLIPLLLAVLLPAGLYGWGLSVCTQSYSDYMTTRLEAAEPLEEYVLERDAAIYYPSFESVGGYFCFLLEDGWSGESFSEGDVVYLLSSMVAANFREQEYIAVSDGEKAGLVEISSLRRLDTPLYDYTLTTAQETPVYRAAQGEASSAAVRTLAAGETLEYLHSQGGFLQVRLADGLEGYVERSCVKLVRSSALVHGALAGAQQGEIG